MIFFNKQKLLDAKEHHFGTATESDFLNCCSPSTLQLGLDFISIQLHGHYGITGYGVSRPGIQN